MAKKPKKIREPQYENLVGSLSDVQILGFKFNSLTESYGFHYNLMRIKLPYLLYDGATERVKIIISKETNPDAYKELGESSGGVYYTPSSINDYE